jgi:hypothetical protein
MAMTERWFIDAWNVVDGKAFASWRGPEQSTAREPRRKGSVFLCAPYFEPEWTSRPSTAMAAWRIGFQSGLRDSEQAEIGFNGLEEVRELVRRAYLGGGGGGMDPEGQVSPSPPPEFEPGDQDLPPDDPPDAKYFDEVERILKRDTLDRNARQELADALLRLFRAARSGSLARFVGESLFFLVTTPCPKPDTTSLLQRWSSAVVEWSLLYWLLAGEGRRDPVSFWIQNYAQEPHRSVLKRWLYWDYPYWDYRYWYLARPTGALDLPRWIPVPASWRAKDMPDWILSLGDQLCFGSASHQSTLRALAERRSFVPILAAAIAMVMIAKPPSRDPARGLPVASEVFGEGILRSAALWLAFNLPDASLQANTPATEALEDMLYGRIHQYHRV